MSEIDIPQELQAFKQNTNCTRCGLCNSSQNNSKSISSVCISGEGPYTTTMQLSDVSLMIVGESPGNNEVTCGYTFIGESGKHLDRLLAHAKINREDLYLTYVTKCRPPKVKQAGGKYKDRSPEPHELLACRRYLEEEIHRVKPKIIMVLGPHAAYSLFHWPEAIVGAPVEVQEAYERVRTDGNASEKDIVTLKKFTTGKDAKHKFPGITFIRGNIYYSKEFDCYIVPSYSPKSCIDSIQATVCLLRDLEMITDEADIVKRGSNKLPVDYKIAKTCAQAVKALKWLKQNATELAVDVETSGLDFLTDEILCMSFSWAEGKSIVIPLKGQFTPDMPEYKRVLKDEQVPCPVIWNPFEWKEIISALKDLLESPILKILQNGKFDIKFFRALNIFLKNFVFDTMLAHHLLDENLPHDLSFLSVWYTDMGSYDLALEAAKPKKDCRYSLIPANVLYPYSCMDTDCTIRVYHKLLIELKKDPDLYHLFKTQVMPFSDALTDIEYIGVKINKELLLEFNEEAEQAIEIIKKEVMEICSPIYKRILPELLEKKIIKKSDGVFNPGSPIQLAAVLFDGLKLKSNKSTETGRRSADESVLEALKDKHELPKKLLTLRKLEKFKSTYLVGKGKDGVETGILPKIDKDGYIHTSFKIHGTISGRISSLDPNLQNIPAEGDNSKVRHIFVPKEGYKFIEADYMAAEVRVLAYISGDPKLIERIQPGRDIHSETAADIFNIPLEEILKMVEEGKCPYRKIAKAALFGIIYGEGVNGLAESAGISYEEAKRVIEAFFETYPLVKKQIKKYHTLIKKGLPLVSPFGRKRRLYANLFMDDTDEAKAKLARALRQGVNAPIQGTASDITVRSIIRLYKAFKDEKLDARIVLTVHDSILIEVHDDAETLERVNNLIDKIMVFKFPGSDIQFLVDKKETYQWEK